MRRSWSSLAFSRSASFWPRSLGTSRRIVPVVGLGSSSAHRLPKRQQIDRSKLMHLPSCSMANLLPPSLDMSRLSGCAVAFATMAYPPSCVCQITGGGWKRSKSGIQALLSCTALGAVAIDATRDSVGRSHTHSQREDMMDSDKEKESTLTPTAQEAIGDAARANVNAAVEVAKSAVGSFVGALTGERKKSSTTRRGARRKKAAYKEAASKRGKAKRSAGGRRSAAASSRRATRKSASSRAKAKRSSTRKTRSAAATRRSTRKAASTRATRKSSQAKRGTSKCR
jgi:hypothetical protein